MCQKTDSKWLMTLKSPSCTRFNTRTPCGVLFTLFIVTAQWTKLSSLDVTSLCHCKSKQIREDLPTQQSSAALFTKTWWAATGRFALCNTLHGLGQRPIEQKWESSFSYDLTWVYFLLICSSTSGSGQCPARSVHIPVVIFYWCLCAFSGWGHSMAATAHRWHSLFT